MRTTVRALALSLLATAAFAHGDQEHRGAVPWTFDAWIVIPLLIIATFYVFGVARVWMNAGYRRGIRPARMLSYLAGWLALAGALCSPLHWLGEHVFTFHMIEHEIIMAVAAPLLALSRPLATYLWALPRRFRKAFGDVLHIGMIRQTWQVMVRPGSATLIHGVTIWAWHLPSLFDAAVSLEWMHRLQHISFLLTALLFWWSLIRTRQHGLATWHLFVTMMHTSILGALMALSPRLLYGAQTADALSWGLTPLEDQQLAGIVMWLPAGTIYAGAALVFMALWINGSGATGSKVQAFSQS